MKMCPLIKCFGLNMEYLCSTYEAYHLKHGTTIYGYMEYNCSTRNCLNIHRHQIDPWLFIFQYEGGTGVKLGDIARGKKYDVM